MSGKSKSEFAPLYYAKTVPYTPEDVIALTNQMRGFNAKFNNDGTLNVKNDADLLIRYMHSKYPPAYAASHWLKHKQVYSFDKNFIDILSDTPVEFILSEEIFDRLPFDTFVIKIEDSYGFIYYDKNNILWSPIKLFVMTPLVEFGGKLNASSITFTVKSEKSSDPLDTKRFLNNLITVPSENYSITELAKTKDFMKSMLWASLYLASKNAVIEENPIQKEIYRPPFDIKNPKNKYSEVRIWDCGIRYTKDRVNEIRADYEYDPKNVKKTGRKVRPYWRRAHFQHYWCGKGRTNLELRWKEPTFCAGKGSEEIPIVVHEE